MKSFFYLLVIFASTGCGDTPAPDSRDGQRGEKADSLGVCAPSDCESSTPSADGCFCDEICASSGDCCQGATGVAAVCGLDECKPSNAMSCDDGALCEAGTPAMCVPSPASACAFTVPSELDLGGEPSSVVIADIDADGCNDIVALIALPAPDLGTISLVVAWGDSSPPFDVRFATQLAGTVAPTPSGSGLTRDSSTEVVAIGDLNSDGKIDIATASGVALGIGGRGFDWIAFPGGETELLQPAAIVEVNVGRVVLRGTKGGKVESCDLNASCIELAGQPEVCPANVLCSIEDLAVADFDHDGLPDVLAGGWPLVSPFVNSSRLWLSSRGWLEPVATEIDIVDYEVGDVDKDGFADVVAQQQEFISDFPSQTHVWLSDPQSPSFFVHAQTFENWDNHTDNAELADVNGDSCLDYLMIGVDEGGVGLMQGVPTDNGQCTGEFVDLGHSLVGNSIGLQQLDVNGDGEDEWILRDALRPVLVFATPAF